MFLKFKLQETRFSVIQSHILPLEELCQVGVSGVILPFYEEAWPD